LNQVDAWQSSIFKDKERNIWWAEFFTDIDRFWPWSFNGMGARLTPLRLRKMLR